METNTFSLLFYTGDIDFQYLESYLLDMGFESAFLSSQAEFTKSCLNHKHDIIIYNAYERGGIDNKILKGLTGTKNLYTPILIIMGSDDNEAMKTALDQRFNMIRFPFSREEFMVRIRMSISRGKSEMAIHNKLVEYNILFENFPAGILQTDIKGNIVRFNKELKGIMGMSDMDLSGMNFFQLCHPDDYLIERQSLDRILRKETDIVSYEVRLINNDGRTIVSKIRASTVWKDQFTPDSFIFSLEKAT